MSIIRNETKSSVLCEEYEVCSSLVSQLRGLMFRLRKKALLFVFPEERIFSIHSLFVFFPFIAIYADSNRRVVDVAHVKPFTPLFRPRAPARYLIEIPEPKGFVERGDLLSW
ncbi:MAG: DUF192 domain-containing protein [Candidatus Micrarchaeia archaeon]